MPRIALTFHSARNDNLGVGALSVSEVAILRRIAEEEGLPVHITVCESRDPRPAYVSGPDITLRPVRVLRKPLDFYRVIRGQDLVIDIGGGDSFADIYGPRRLLRMLLTKAIVLLARRPLVHAPQTYGPFRSRLLAALSRRVIDRSALVVSRDRESIDFLRELGVTRPVIEASDVALRLPYDPPAPAAGGPVKVGLNVSGLLMSGGYTRDNMFGLTMDYRALMRDLIGDFLNHPAGCEVHLVPHVLSWPTGKAGDPYVECDRLASLELAADHPGVKVAPAFASPSEAKGYIAGMDFFAGARMHACIAAFSTGVPVVPMAYSRKFAGLFGTLGYDRTVDCTAADADTVRAAVLAGFEARETLRDEAGAALERGLGKLAAYETALAGLLRDLAGGDQPRN